MSIRVGEKTVWTKQITKYFAVIIDLKLSLCDQIR